MIISSAKRFVMFAPWKTASQTMHARLQKWNDSPYSAWFHFNPHLNRVVHQHMTCADFLLLPESKLGYLLASFVRNPYDRVYSGFLQLQRDFLQQPGLPFDPPWIQPMVARQIADNVHQFARAGFRFDDWLATIEDHQVYEAGRNTNFPLHPSHYWTHVAGRQVVDFIGKVENFEEDFRAFLDKVGIADTREINLNESDGVQGGERSGYRYPGLMSRASIDRINDLFHDDFELFGYRKL